MSTAVRPSERGVLDRDRYHMVRKGWFPRTNFEALEAMRVRHEALIDQRDAVQAREAQLRERFDAEDAAKASALRDAYRDGTEPALPETTSPDERARMRAEAREHTDAATRVAYEYALEMLDRLRGELPDGWNPHLAAQARRVPPHGEAAGILALLADEARELQDQVEQARRAMEEADRKLRECLPLHTWLVRNANGKIEPATQLTVPERYTYFTKPEGTPDPPSWPSGWQQGHGEGGGVEHPIDDDAEEGVVEMSDPWFAAQEARPAQSIATKEF